MKTLLLGFIALIAGTMLSAAEPEPRQTPPTFHQFEKLPKELQLHVMANIPAICSNPAETKRALQAMTCTAKRFSRLSHCTSQNDLNFCSQLVDSYSRRFNIPVPIATHLLEIPCSSKVQEQWLKDAEKHLSQLLGNKVRIKSSITFPDLGIHKIDGSGIIDGWDGSFRTMVGGYIETTQDDNKVTHTPFLTTYKQDRIQHDTQGAPRPSNVHWLTNTDGIVKFTTTWNPITMLPLNWENYEISLSPRLYQAGYLDKGAPIHHPLKTLWFGFKKKRIRVVIFCLLFNKGTGHQQLFMIDHPFNINIIINLIQNNFPIRESILKTSEIAHALAVCKQFTDAQEWSYSTMGRG